MAAAAVLPIRFSPSGTAKVGVDSQNLPVFKATLELVIPLAELVEALALFQTQSLQRAGAGRPAESELPTPGFRPGAPEFLPAGLASTATADIGLGQLQAAAARLAPVEKKKSPKKKQPAAVPEVPSQTAPREQPSGSSRGEPETERGPEHYTLYLNDRQDNGIGLTLDQHRAHRSMHRGWPVTGLKQDSWARKSGVEENDELVSINNTNVWDVGEDGVKEMLNDCRPLVFEFIRATPGSPRVGSGAAAKAIAAPPGLTAPSGSWSSSPTPSAGLAGRGGKSASLAGAAAPRSTGEPPSTSASSDTQAQQGGSPATQPAGLTAAALGRNGVGRHPQPDDDPLMSSGSSWSSA